GSDVKIDFARLNYILIPKKKEEIDRFRASLFGRAAAPIVRFIGSFTEEGRTLAIVAMLVGAFGIDVGRTSVYVLFAALAALVVGSLAAARGLTLEGGRVHADAPRRITVGETATFAIACTGLHEPGGALRFRGPFLPWDGTWVERAPVESAIDDRGAASAKVKARFVQRGVHHLDGFTAAAIAPLGLTCGPRLQSDPVKLVVVPRVANVVRLPIVLAARHQPGGVALASNRGESRDLLGVRPYRVGDRVRDLHARSWARTGVPVVREYQQEYFTRVGVVLDTDVRDRDPDSLEAAVELAAGVVAHLSRGEALVDILVVGDRVHELTLGRSLGYLDQALDMLATVEPGPPLRAADVIRRLEPYLERLSSVVVIALGEDGRQEVERTIAGRGPSCTTLVIDAELERAIANKEALAW
ncbi:MAG TPA: DUF58 domain-containing protein, partial [Labilithrix sp.]